ncbi:MAG: Rpn family recombination-promoting nuclease/putative transposase [Synergistaceae bacterium]|jgi:hypothetical protein|nr:Rpn family recombination-promoting nuclease/putative transposase [Synergistaceae bacterium]
MTINRKNDYAFKRIFGHEDTKDILAGFLSAVLDVPIQQEELTLIPTVSNPDDRSCSDGGGDFREGRRRAAYVRAVGERP